MTKGHWEEVGGEAGQESWKLVHQPRMSASEKLFLASAVFGCIGLVLTVGVICWAIVCP